MSNPRPRICHLDWYRKVYRSERSAEEARLKKIDAGVRYAEALYVQQCPIADPPHWHLIDPKCRAKVRHSTEAEASRKLVRVQRKGLDARRVYKCNHCHGWHLTTIEDWEDRPAAWGSL